MASIFIKPDLNLANKIATEVDTNHDKKITVAEFQAALQKTPDGSRPNLQYFMQTNTQENLFKGKTSATVAEFAKRLTTPPKED